MVEGVERIMLFLFRFLVVQMRINRLFVRILNVLNVEELLLQFLALDRGVLFAIHHLEAVRLNRDQDRSRVTFAILGLDVLNDRRRSCWLIVGPHAGSTLFTLISICLSARFDPTFGSTSSLLFLSQYHVDIFLIQKQSPFLELLYNFLFAIDLFLDHDSLGGPINFVKLLRRFGSRGGILAAKLFRRRALRIVKVGRLS